MNGGDCISIVQQLYDKTTYLSHKDYKDKMRSCSPGFTVANSLNWR